MRDVPTAGVGPAAFRVFRKKARQFAETMEAALEAGNPDAAASAASHCAISTCDALLAAHRGLRSRERDHAAVLRLVETTGLPGIRERARRLETVLALKQVAEYDDTEVSINDASTAVKQARRFLDWAETQLKP
jgi:HEPN domain-containing protein